MFEPQGSTAGRSPQKVAVVAAVATLLTTLSIASSYLELRLLLLVAYLFVAMTVLLTPFLRRCSINQQDQIFAILLGSASLSLLLSTTLSSPNLLGWDIHQEFNLFTQVSKAGIWRPRNDLAYDSVVSITILPSVLSLVSGLDGLTIFRITYPAIFSATPIILYRVYRKVLDPASAFLSAFLVISYSSFYLEMSGLAKQEIAEFFLALLILISLSMRSNMNLRATETLTVLLIIGVITAHYSLAYILIAGLAFCYVSSRLFRRYRPLVGLAGLLLALAIASLWYLFLANTGFFSLFNFMSFVSHNLESDFLSPSSRPLAVLQAFGLASVTPGPLHDINRATNYLTNAILALGFVATALRRPRSVAERKMFPLLLGGMTFLGLAVIIPHIASGLNLSRTYHLYLILSSPCFPYGITALKRASHFVQPLFRGRSINPSLHVSFSGSQGLAASLLLLYFIFSSGWIWAATMGLPTSPVLDSQRMSTSENPVMVANFLSYHTSPRDIAAARWSVPNLPQQSLLCADLISRLNVLTSYAARARPFSFGSAQDVLPRCDLHEAFVFSSEFNTLFGLADNRGNEGILEWHNLFSITVENRIFCDGGAEILDPI